MQLRQALRLHDAKRNSVDFPRWAWHDRVQTEGPIQNSRQTPPIGLTSHSVVNVVNPTRLRLATGLYLRLKSRSFFRLLSKNFTSRLSRQFPLRLTCNDLVKWQTFELRNVFPKLWFTDSNSSSGKLRLSKTEIPHSGGLRRKDQYVLSALPI